VNKFPEKLTLKMVSGLLFILSFLMTGALCPALAADQEQKIRITADRLVANTQTGRAEFSGNVKATQGSTVITSDRLEIHYAQDTQPGEAVASDTAIRSIISSGNVVIHFDDKVATTDRAVYHSKSGIFTLTGKGTRVTSGDNTITGEKITVDRINDRMTVESGKASRVNAVIFTGPEGLAKPAPDAEPQNKPEN